MFGRDSRQTARIDTLIARNTRIQGDVVFAGGLHLDGRVQGNVRAEPGTGGTLSVSEHGSVEGSVEVASVVLNGTAAERVVLGAHARVQGNVHYGVIEMEIGAEIRGKLVPAPPRAGVADAVAGDALAASGAVAA